MVLRPGESSIPPADVRRERSVPGRAQDGLGDGAALAAGEGLGDGGGLGLGDGCGEGLGDG
jgi:hypothetical protein